jgi:hypothetical protein
VRTLKGSMRGTIVSLLPDGRVVWRTDSGAELIALPEALLVETPPLPHKPVANCGRR